MANQAPILVATDLSARSDRPFERAFLLSKQLAAPLIVLHVVEGRKKLQESERERLHALIEQEFSASAENSEVILAHGQVNATIARVAEERDCALVITGVARFNSPSDYVLGTAVDHLVRKSASPVLVVKRKPRKPYRKLLVGTDYSIASREALLVAADLFDAAQIRLVHVFHSAYDAFLAHDTTADYIHSEADEQMRKFVEDLPADVAGRIDTKVVEGHLASTIEAEIRSFEADLLVLGTEGRSGFAQMTIGSQAADLLQYEPCDVMTVRSGHS